MSGHQPVALRIVLLQHGAKFVYAVDVGYGELAWRIRTDSRVRPIERTNIRTIDLNLFDQPIEIGVIDVAFISLRKVLPAVSQIVEPSGRHYRTRKTAVRSWTQNMWAREVLYDHPHIHAQVLTGDCPICTRDTLVHYGSHLFANSRSRR